MAGQAKKQLTLELDGRETFDQAMRSAFENCRGLKHKNYEDVIHKEPHLRRLLEIMAEIRIKGE